MSQKPDYYAVLGIEKTASEGDIKKAFMRITMTCHPDALKNKQLSDEKRAEAEEKFKYGKEAQAVLLDPVKRAAYDKFGHAGLDSMKGASGASEQSWTDAMGPVKKRTRTDAEVFDYFDRAAERNGDAPKQNTGSSGSDMSEEEMRRAAAEARRRNRGQNVDSFSNVSTSPPKAENKPAPEPAPAAKPAASAKPANSSSVSGVFAGVASKMSEAADRLRAAAEADAPVPVAALEKFKDSLENLLDEVDGAIRQARRNPPKNGYNR